MIIAIDGPAARQGHARAPPCGHYGLPHLDTGLLYRATAAALIARTAISATRRQRSRRRAGSGLTDFDEALLRTRQMGEAASVVAAMPGVREALVQAQRNFARGPAARCSTGATSEPSSAPGAESKSSSPPARQRARNGARWNSRARGEKRITRPILADICSATPAIRGAPPRPSRPRRTRNARYNQSQRRRGDRRGGKACRSDPPEVMRTDRFGYPERPGRVRPQRRTTGCASRATAGSRSSISSRWRSRWPIWLTICCGCNCSSRSGVSVAPFPPMRSLISVQGEAELLSADDHLHADTVGAAIKTRVSLLARPDQAAIFVKSQCPEALARKVGTSRLSLSRR